jgi:hypothetical protein
MAAREKGGEQRCSGARIVMAYRTPLPSSLPGKRPGRAGMTSVALEEAHAEGDWRTGRVAAWQWGLEWRALGVNELEPARRLGNNCTAGRGAKFLSTVHEPMTASVSMESSARAMRCQRRCRCRCRCGCRRRSSGTASRGKAKEGRLEDGGASQTFLSLTRPCAHRSIHVCVLAT